MDYLNRGLAKLEIQHRPLESFNLGEGPFCMSFGFELSSLKASISKVGLISIPIVTEMANGQIEIISGLRRVIALKEMGFFEIPCRVFTAEDLSPKNALYMAFYENVAVRFFNEVEKAMALARLNLYFTIESMLDEFMPLLGLPRSEKVLSYYLDVNKKFDEKMKLSLAQGLLNPKAAKRLAGYDGDSSKKVFLLIEKLKLNFNYQLQLIELLEDISSLENLTVARVVESDPIINSIIENQHMNIPQKAKALMDHLRVKRFPRISMAMKLFQEKVKSFGLPPEVKLKAPPFLEGENYTLEITFKSGQHLKELMKKTFENRTIYEMGSTLEEAANV